VANVTSAGVHGIAKLEKFPLPLIQIMMEV
jgi:hypothetical protein